MPSVAHRTSPEGATLVETTSEDPYSTSRPPTVPSITPSTSLAENTVGQIPQSTTESVSSDVASKKSRIVALIVEAFRDTADKITRYKCCFYKVYYKEYQECAEKYPTRYYCCYYWKFRDDIICNRKSFQKRTLKPKSAKVGKTVIITPAPSEDRRPATPLPRRDRPGVNMETTPHSVDVPGNTRTPARDVTTDRLGTTGPTEVPESTGTPSREVTTAEREGTTNPTEVPESTRVPRIDATTVDRVEAASPTAPESTGVPNRGPVLVPRNLVEDVVGNVVSQLEPTESAVVITTQTPSTTEGSDSTTDRSTSTSSTASSITSTPAGSTITDASSTTSIASTAESTDASSTSIASTAESTDASSTTSTTSTTTSTSASTTTGTTTSTTTSTTASTTTGTTASSTTGSTASTTTGTTASSTTGSTASTTTGPTASSTTGTTANTTAGTTASTTVRPPGTTATTTPETGSTTTVETGNASFTSVF